MVLVGVLITGGLAVTSASAGGSHSDDETTTIWLKAKAVEEVEVDTDGSGDFSLGDQIVFTDDLYLKRTKVGTLEGFCVVQRIDDPDATIQCMVTAVVDGAGQITHQGVIPVDEDGLPRKFALAITGGTGDFAGAEGQTKIIPVSETKVRLKVQLED